MMEDLLAKNQKGKAECMDDISPKRNQLLDITEVERYPKEKRTKNEKEGVGVDIYGKMPMEAAPVSAVTL